MHFNRPSFPPVDNYVGSDNPGAQRLYEKCGFKNIDTAFFMQTE